jgi:hypothetical protein
MKYLSDIKAKLSAEEADSLSDKEIERVFKDCVCGHWLVPLTKKYRDNGVLVLK